MDTNKYKEMLLEEKKALTGLVSEMQDNTLFGNTTSHSSENFASGELSSYDNHPADMGTDLYMQNMQNSLTMHEQQRLDSVNKALDRIQNGTYGVCEMCSQKIDEDRLDIIPESSLCFYCSKQEHDNNHTNLNEQNLINKGSTFYDVVGLQLNEMNKMPHDFSDRD